MVVCVIYDILLGASVLALHLKEMFAAMSPLALPPPIDALVPHH